MRECSVVSSINYLNLYCQHLLDVFLFYIAYVECTPARSFFSLSTSFFPRGLLIDIVHAFEPSESINRSRFFIFFGIVYVFIIIYMEKNALSRGQQNADCAAPNPCYS